MTRPQSRSFRNRLLLSFLIASLAPMIICSAMLSQISRIQMTKQLDTDAQTQTAHLMTALDRISDALPGAARALEESRLLPRAFTGREDTHSNTALFLATVVLACIPQNSFFRSESGALLGKTPLMDSIVVLISLLFFLPGVVYGRTTGVFRSSADVAEALSKSMAGMGSFLALAFVAAQFIKYFEYTQLGTILALGGASFFRSIQIGLIPLTVIFVLFSAFMNLFMGSASAKWNILAPVFVPMFMLLGYSPELCQLAYRIGDSCTNVITPMMTYYAVILLFARRYDKDAGMGTVTAAMVPYSLAFLVGWTLLLIVWLLLGLPIGVGTSVFYPAI